MDVEEVNKEKGEKNSEKSCVLHVQALPQLSVTLPWYNTNTFLQKRNWLSVNLLAWSNSQFRDCTGRKFHRGRTLLLEKFWPKIQMLMDVSNFCEKRIVFNDVTYLHRFLLLAQNIADQFLSQEKRAILPKPVNFEEGKSKRYAPVPT